jgi:adenylate cyclase
MSANTTRRLRTAIIFMIVCVPVSLCYEFIDSALDEDLEAKISGAGVVIGIVLAMPLALLEESTFDERVRRLPFSVAILAKSLTYIASLLAVFLSVGFVAGLLQGLTIDDFRASLTDPNLAMQVGVGFVLYLTIVFFRQLDRLLGPGVLLRYMLGRYHRPRREARIFMFLDLKSSTTLAEELGHEAYYGLVNDFFRDISGPVLDNAGEIYEYVGDEVVLTWKEGAGLKDAHCIRVFFDIDRIIEKNRQRYLDRFGVVPEFKAGVHLGEVMTAEIGDLKKGLVFNGDVLNTGSRIEKECARLGRRLLASADLFARLTLPEGWTVEEMGPATLRGKSEPLDLVAFA